MTDPTPAAPPNSECPECAHKFYVPLRDAFRDVQIAMCCPNKDCGNPVLIQVKTHKAKWKGRCKAKVAAVVRGKMQIKPCAQPICDRVIMDLPFAVREKESHCAACNLIAHLKARYGDKVIEAYEAAKKEKAIESTKAN